MENGLQLEKWFTLGKMGHTLRKVSVEEMGNTWKNRSQSGNVLHLDKMITLWVKLSKKKSQLEKGGHPCKG